MSVELTRAPATLQAAIYRAIAKEEQTAKAPPPVPEVINLTVWGRARPSKRITGDMVHTPVAQGYLRWQEEVAEHCIAVTPRPLPWAYVQVDMVFYFVPPKNEKHPDFGDRINLGKAVEDGLARGGLFPTVGGRPDDSRIRWGNVGVLYCKLKKRERVEITLREFKMPDPVD